MVQFYIKYSNLNMPIFNWFKCHVTRACEGVVFSSINIDRTSTKTGLKVFTNVKNKVYKTGREVSDFSKENMELFSDS
jgi:hypothetical protein